MTVFNFLFFLYTYILFYLHNQKNKIILFIGKKFFNYDFILIYFFIGLILNYFTKFIKEKFYRCIFLLFIYIFILFFYFQQSLCFLHNFFYQIENLFFYIFGLLGISLYSFFFSPLLSLFSLIILLIIEKIFFHKILGIWYFIPYKYIYITILILILYNILNVILLKEKNFFSKESEENFQKIEKKKIIKKDIYSSLENSFYEEDILIKKDSKKIYKKFDKNEIDSIYNTIICNEKEKEEEDLSIRIQKILEIFQIYGEITKVISGINVINYFFKPKLGTKMYRIESLEEELSLELNRTVRITLNLSGVVFEVAKEFPRMFSFKEVWEEKIENIILPIFLGFDTMNNKIILDLTKSPHILMCGTTGSGKSSTLHSIINSLLTHKNPEELQLILIDPKILELNIYHKIPHLWKPIITNITQAEEVLQLLVEEMEKRYKIISLNNKRSILEYNKTSISKLPYLVFCIEEFADLVLYKNNNFKTLVQKLAQMGRAAGIHGIMCTQRPSVNVIDGVIKANLPTRIALKVSNKLESRIILDTAGAEKLTSAGELILLDNSGICRRGICAYISEEEILRLINKF